MYKISEKKNHKPHLECHGKRKGRIDSGRRNSSRVKKIQRDIFERISLSPLLCVLVIMPLKYVLRKYTGSCHKFTKSQENINDLMYMNGIKIFAK